MNFKSFLIENRLLLERQIFYDKSTTKFIKGLYNSYKKKIDDPDEKIPAEEKEDYIIKLNSWFGVKEENDKPVFKMKGELYNWLVNIYLSDKDNRSFVSNDGSDKNTIFKNSLKLFYTDKNKVDNNGNIKFTQKQKNKIDKYGQKEEWIKKSDSNITNPKNDKNLYELNISKDKTLQKHIEIWLDKMFNNFKRTKKFKIIDRMIDDQNTIEHKIIGTVLLTTLSNGWEVREISKPSEENNTTEADVTQACKYEGTEMQNCIEKLHTNEILEGKEIIYSIRNNQNTPKCSIAVQNKKIIEFKGKQNEAPIDEYFDPIAEALNYLKKENKFDVIKDGQICYMYGVSKKIIEIDNKYQVASYNKKTDGTLLIKKLSNNCELRKFCKPTKKNKLIRTDVMQACDYENYEMKNDNIETEYILNNKEIIYSIRNENDTPQCTIGIMKFDGKLTIIDLVGKSNEAPSDEYFEPICEALNYLKDKNKFEVIDENQLKFMKGETKDIIEQDGKFIITHCVYSNELLNDLITSVVSLDNNVEIKVINQKRDDEQQRALKTILKKYYNIQNKKYHTLNYMYYMCFKNNELMFIISVCDKAFEQIFVPNKELNYGTFKILDEKYIDEFLDCLTYLKNNNIIDKLYHYRFSDSLSDEELKNRYFYNNQILVYKNKKYSLINFNEWKTDLLSKRLKTIYTNKENDIHINYFDKFGIYDDYSIIILKELFGEEIYNKHIKNSRLKMAFGYYIFYHNNKILIISYEYQDYLHGEVLEKISNESIKNSLKEALNYMKEKRIFKFVSGVIYTEIK